MLSQRRRRCANNKTTFGERPVLARKALPWRELGFYGISLSEWEVPSHCQNEADT